MAKKTSVNRRGFLKGAGATAAAGAAALVAPPVVVAQEPAPENATAQPNTVTLAADTGRRPATASARVIEHPGSDFMVDVLKSLGFEYVAANPGSTFEGLHESLINYGNNTMPEFLTCCHEESAVAMAHGYAKVEGKPMIAMMHGTIGMQHASMAIYNAFADRVPMLVLTGNIGNLLQLGAVIDGERHDRPGLRPACCRPMQMIELRILAQGAARAAIGQEIIKLDPRWVFRRA